MNNRYLALSLVTCILLISGCGKEGFEYNDLYWQVGPDRDMTWNDAKEWVDGLEGSWRMPAVAELQALWDAGVSKDNWGPFTNSGLFVWSGERQDSSSVWAFYFIYGNEFEVRSDAGSNGRAFAVRVMGE